MLTYLPLVCNGKSKFEIYFWTITKWFHLAPLANLNPSLKVKVVVSIVLYVRLLLVRWAINNNNKESISTALGRQINILFNYKFTSYNSDKPLD